jgi:acid phosphatase type 7
MRAPLALSALVAIALTAYACTSKNVTAPAVDDEEDAGVDAGPVCAGSGIQKGPFVVSTSATSAKIRWESCRADVPKGLVVTQADGTTRAVSGTASTFTLTKEYEAFLTPKAAKDLPGPVWTHEVAVEGLTPGTCSTYALDGDRTKTGAFCTLRPSTDELRFLAIGDTNPGLLRTGPLLAHAKTATFSPDFVFHLGDIQYYDSRLETWASWFPLMQPLLSLGGFFAVLGNHEFENSTDYTEFYHRLFEGKGFSGTDRWYTFESAGIVFVVLDTESPMDDASDQGTWMRGLLSSLEARKSSPDYRGAVVGFHKPFLTCGDTYDNPTNLALWEPRFVAAGVATVLAGHMHGYERFDHGGRPWIVTGGGGGAIREPSQNMSRSYCNERTKGGGYYHFMRIRSEGTKLRMEAVDDTGAVIDSFDAPLLRGPRSN